MYHIVQVLYMYSILCCRVEAHSYTLFVQLVHFIHLLLTCTDHHVGVRGGLTCQPEDFMV